LVLKDFNIEQIKVGEFHYDSLFRAIVGSHAYNLNDEHSDFDYVGLFNVPAREYANIYPVPPEQTIFHSKEKDVTFYSLKRIMHLLSLCNPNMLEILWSPERCIEYKHPAIDFLFKNRDIFLSTRAKYTYTGYAHSQIIKATGNNKWISNQKPEKHPKLEDFCKIIVDSKNGMPARTVPCDLDLAKYNVSRVEGGHNLYRLYYYGDDAKGVFCGGQVVCQSIPIEHESEKFAGLMIVDEDLYKKESKDWKNYWDWVKNRNPERWTPKEGKGLIGNYKNLSHCIRLMYSAINIFKEGFPFVEMSGEKRKIVLDIKRGLWHYDDVIKKAEDLELEFEEVFEQNKTKFPKCANQKKINEVFLETVERAERFED
jgi:uncharacterized protein